MGCAALAAAAGASLRLPHAPRDERAIDAMPAREKAELALQAQAPRPQLDGKGFPDKVLALTWDDGPDAGTFELAQYLHRENVSATFFVVSSWSEEISDDPGEGEGVFETGYEDIPVLGDLVALGHRIANHTLNHVQLHDVDAATVTYQLGENQARIDRFITNGFRLFRAPGGAWNAAASWAVDADPRTRSLVGPIRWDVDGKDWEKSLYCRSSRPSVDCERAAPGHAPRVKPSAVAKRYLDAIEAAGHGVVLFHDRVGDVGSRYAIEVARRVIPALKARGYVFAAPVLRFSELAPRPPEELSPRGTPPLGDVDGDGQADMSDGRGDMRFGDVNGDGKTDVCMRERGGVSCALATARGYTTPTTWVRPEELTVAGLAEPGSTLELGDVNGDGRADLCGRGPSGVVCGLAP